MKNCFKNRQFFNILLLIFLVEFLVFPRFCLADDFENITTETMEKYLELPERDVENLLSTLKQVFTNDWIYRESSGFSSEEECLVPLILREVIRIQALNHLLVEAPIEITLKIIKNAAKIAQIFLAQDLGSIFEELERESVKMAVNYGMKTLLENEIRVTPGVIEFKYTSQKGGERTVIFQYILIYQPLDIKHGKVAIRFYSPKSIESPQNKMSVGGASGISHGLTKDLSPFIVEINGKVEKDAFNNYSWINRPSVKIDFPETVPDLGIKPLTFWEKQILQPIISSIREIEVIITKVTGKSFKVVEKIYNIFQTASNVWDKIKSNISQITPFPPAIVVQTPSTPSPSTKLEEEIEIAEPEVQPQKPSTQPQKEEQKQLTLEEIQERLDDITERIDILSQKIAELAKEKGIKLAMEKKEKVEEEEKLEETEEGKEKYEKEEICWVNINTASYEELQKITGVGPVFAQRIIEARPFYSLNDLLKVKGIGPAILQKIIVQGCAYVETFYFAGGAPSSSASYPKILISEIQIEGSDNTKDDFVELYNPDDQNVDLTDWYLQRKTKAASDFLSYAPKNLFLGKKILAKDYFLIANASSSFLNLADATTTYPLTEDNTLYLKNPNGEIVDKVGWGEAQDYETATATIPQPGESLGRKWSTINESYIDTDNNYNDFEIQIPTPKEKNKPRPEEIGENLSLNVVINEIAWMGTRANSSDEWIEFYNASSSTVDITNWSIYGADTGRCLNFADADGTTTVLISPGDYLIYANCQGAVKNETGQSIVNIWDATMGMNNTSPGQLILYDTQNCQGNIVDIANQTTGNWFAGKNENLGTSENPNWFRVSMERINATTTGATSINWANNNLITRNGKDADGNNINGTPKSENSVSKSQTEISYLPFNEFSELTLTYLGSPYLIENNLFVPTLTTLKIEPGVVLKFFGEIKKLGDAKEIEVRGNLEAIGGKEEEEKIIFMRNSTSTPTADRYRIHFSGSQNSKIENVKFIEGGRLTYVPFYAPRGLISGVLDIENSEIFIKDSSILQSFPLGFHISNSTTTIENVEFSDIKDSDDFKNTVALFIEGGSSIVKNSTFRKNTIGIKISLDAKPQIENNFFEENNIPIYLLGTSDPIFFNNQAQNNNLNGIFVDASTIIYDTAWEGNLPYIIESGKSIAQDVTLTLKEGMVVKFLSGGPSGYGGYLEIYGKLISEGTQSNPVLITSITDSYESIWNRLVFDRSGSILNETIIRYGSGNCDVGYCWGAITQLKDVEIEIKNSIIEKNGWGIFSNEENCQKVFEKIKLENVTFLDNARNISLFGGTTCEPP